VYQNLADCSTWTSPVEPDVNVDVVIPHVRAMVKEDFWAAAAFAPFPPIKDTSRRKINSITQKLREIQETSAEV